MTATVTVRAPAGLQPIDELILWGLLGATLSRQDPQPALLATPFWMLRRLGFETGGSQYAQLRESLLRLALVSYQNTAFYNPETREHEVAAFQFLSVLLPTVGGRGEAVDNDRCWHVEWNPAFFRFCRAAGGNLLFDLDLYRGLSPAARRLFLKLKDRFWRSGRVFMNVDELTVHGLGFSAARPLAKRKFDLARCVGELVDQHVLALGRGHTGPVDLFLKRGKGRYVVAFYEGDYFRAPAAAVIEPRKNALHDDPLYEPLRAIGVDGPAIRRLLAGHTRGLVQRWVRITDAAMHDRPRGFPGFRVSPAAYLIDGVENRRTPPDWFFACEKRRDAEQRRREDALAAADEQELRRAYHQDRAAALAEYLASPEGRQRYHESYETLLALYRATDPHRAPQAARAAAEARIDRLSLRFPDYTAWLLARETRGEGESA